LQPLRAISSIVPSRTTVEREREREEGNVSLREISREREIERELCLREERVSVQKVTA
jgi:hypothetical protein